MKKAPNGAKTSVLIHTPNTISISPLFATRDVYKRQTLGTGVGSGIVVNGQLVYGHDGFAGEDRKSVV